MRVLVIHGPNLNLLGVREPATYGTQSLEEINAMIDDEAERAHAHVKAVQYNDEGAIIDELHRAREEADAVIINPGAYSHYSHAIADAIAAIALPTIEVHLTNIFSREPFRRTSVIAPVCAGSICGFGAHSYVLALRAAALFDAAK